MNSLLHNTLGLCLLGAALASPGRAEDHVIPSWFLGMTPVDIEAVTGDVVKWTLVLAPHDVRYDPSLDGQDLDVVADGALICADDAASIQIDAGGVAEYTLDTSGIYYFYCATAFPGHCSGGSMRVKVTVTGDATSAPESSVQPWSMTKAMYR
jgi:plastocyanin